MFKDWAIALAAAAGITLHLLLRYLFHASAFAADLPLLAVLAYAGVPLLVCIMREARQREGGSDVLAGISIITAVILHEFLAGALVVLMFSGGKALDERSKGRASLVLGSLAKRTPQTAHRLQGTEIEDVPAEDVEVGDHLAIFPHDLCPADGIVEEGHGVMDESFLTGEPYMISKTPGARVISGAVNGEKLLKVRATKRAHDSRFARIVSVIKESESHRARLRRLADRLGLIYTPFALLFAVAAWALSGEGVRFLAVLVIATPCPLLLGIPIAIIGSISLAAKRGIIIKDPAVLEQVGSCKTLILDKTGTLTMGRPQMTEIIGLNGFDPDRALVFAASLERYSKHPLAGAVIEAAEKAGAALLDAREIDEPPGEGLRGKLGGHHVQITSRKGQRVEDLPPTNTHGLECLLLVDGKAAALFRFDDRTKKQAKPFISHLTSRHDFKTVMLLSGDRESEVNHVASQLGITRVHANKSPEEKAEIAAQERQKAKTIFIGDGVNDAPGLLNSTVGIAMGSDSDITAGAAGAVILDSSLSRVDELFHISRRMRAIALQSAVGGMSLSVIGMFFAALGCLTPVEGAVAQEVIDLAAVVNALRAASVPKNLIDF